MLLSEGDSGRRIGLSSRETIVVRLAESPSTGYRWAPTISDRIELLREESDAADSMGGSGTHTFEFKASRAGTFELRLALRRAFEPDVPPLQVFRVTLVVA